MRTASRASTSTPRARSAAALIAWRSIGWATCTRWVSWALRSWVSSCMTSSRVCVRTASCSVRCCSNRFHSSSAARASCPRRPSCSYIAEMAVSDSLSAAKACSAASWRADCSVSAPARAAFNCAASASAAASSLLALSISEVTSKVDSLRSDPPLTQPAPTRSPSTVTARSSGRISTRPIASVRSLTTATPESMAIIAPTNCGGDSTRSRAHWAPLGSISPEADWGACGAGQSLSTRTARPPSACLSALTALPAAVRPSTASASAAGPSAAASAAS
ncbi:Uncharacterised protein [Mycobacterium tuberculosis]|nr:Uncharacterised protein [Mycobacterium tuberculosis]CFH13958.1 Uncharacterised protein [Mycobacterium tuberculosis]CFS19289.1 Uncharacterised protein [Mycobacterium tuberculosis]CFS20908.1 Uncharacterised protein [Mycobacterium tuberculosis]CKL72910.1 Uncharacterised protein [Mycobacterium tuberculosis]